MEQLAKDFVGKAHFPFMYVREAHPGELYGAHQSFEQKFAHARAFREYGVERQILVDSLYGKIHRQYGGVSNMTYVLDHTGHIAFRAEWTVADDVRAVLEEVVEMHEIRRAGGRVGLYYRETLGMHRSADNPFLGGQQAVEDMQRALRGE
ncbi:MAG: hypothetical protein O2826_01795 [Chloroflexi bacterium]|nr:hypothetical protein [Chloroflexota bacterium]MDA1173234.1 hypothetical protein [Chloroflexota bacterium]